MIYRMVLVLATLAVAGCNPFVNPAVGEAKRAVSEQLIDGESARFENVVTQKTTMDNDTTMRPLKTGEEAVCGWVNAKNRMGGYVGSERFLVKDGLPIFQGNNGSTWTDDFAMCVIHSNDKEATDRLTREGQRAMQAYSDAVDAMMAR